MLWIGDCKKEGYKVNALAVRRRDMRVQPAFHNATTARRIKSREQLMGLHNQTWASNKHDRQVESNAMVDGRVKDTMQGARRSRSSVQSASKSTPCSVGTTQRLHALMAGHAKKIQLSTDATLPTHGASKLGDYDAFHKLLLR